MKVPVRSSLRPGFRQPDRARSGTNAPHHHRRNDRLQSAGSVGENPRPQRLCRRRQRSTVPAQERKVDAGLNYRPHGGEPSLVEQFPNDVFPPERHTGPGECSMEDQ